MKKKLMALYMIYKLYGKPNFDIDHLIHRNTKPYYTESTQL